uniref:SH3 domain-containing protein n=1 Tax=Paenibacillus zanthoxyli TaxID=369399 RepID=UPI00046EAD91
MNKQTYHVLRPNAVKQPARPGRPALFRRMAAAAAITLLSLMLTSHTAQADSYTAKVYATSLNVRSEPAGGAAVTGAVKGGALVTVTDEQHGWLKIRTRNTTGWVAGYYLKKASGTAASSQSAVTAVKKIAAPRSSTAIVTAGSLRIRSGPGTGYDVIGSL